MDTRSARITAAALLVVAALIHVALIVQFPILVLDLLFAASAAGMLLGAVLLPTRFAVVGWVLGGGTALLTLLGYVLRSTVGLPGVLPAIPFFIPITGPISVVVEVVAVVVAARALAGRRRAATSHPSGATAQA